MPTRRSEAVPIPLLQRVYAAADAYFLSDDIRRLSANELAYTRIGVIGCIAVGLAGIAFIPWQLFHWPAHVLIAMMASGLFCVALPFLLRRRDGIRHLGHFVCGQVSVYALAVIVLSGGRATGILPVLPMIPMLALLMRGGRAVISWGLVTVGVIAVGALLVNREVPALIEGFRELRHEERYPIALICLIAMLGVSFLFERLWNRSALELAERARADLALREDRYRTLLEHASEGILVLDARGRIQFASPAVERLIGLDPGSAVGRTLVSLTDERGLEETVPMWNRALSRPGERVRVELRATVRPLPDGSPPPRLEITITNHLDHPAVRGVVVHLHDVTALARAKTNYQNLVERSLQGFIVVREFRVVYANQAMADLFGVSTDHFVGRHVNEMLDWVEPDDRDRVVEALNAPVLAPMDPLELRIRRADGARRWIQIRWSDAVSEGLTARQIVYADITAQKELDASRRVEQERLEARIAERTRELEASQQTLRAQERLAAVGTLAAGVAHQINNPVGAILAAADFALIAAGDPDRDRIAATALEEIKAQAIRCGRIIRGILQFSRAESTEKWSGDVISVLRTAVDVTRRHAREQGAEVSLELDRGVAAASVLMSPIELEQVFVNLILNAIQAQSAGAKVWITARNLGHELEICVEDDGPGIPTDDRDRIFDPFFTTRLKGGGTGLGLSVAHGIIEDHGGRMELVPARRRPGVGACFQIVLPVEKSELGIPTGLEA
ncbi:MAG: PAS domain S-box protein [Deltaproteobacteria bacterium]|nr:PAS domain S-box protein [Deltaproteobacteria bacterium]